MRHPYTALSLTNMKPFSLLGDVGARFLSGTLIFVFPTLASIVDQSTFSYVITNLKIHRLFI